MFTPVDKISEYLYTNQHWTISSSRRRPALLPWGPRTASKPRHWRTTMSTACLQADSTVNTEPAVNNVTEKPELPHPQIAAIDALLAGKSATDAAAAAGVSRRTLYTWTRDNFRFQAALNRGRREAHQAISSRVAQIATEAAECVGCAVH